MAPKSDLSGELDSAEVTLRELAPAHTVERKRFLIDSVVQRRVSGGDSELKRRRDLASTYKVGPLALLRLRSGWVETRMCVALTADGRYVKDTLRARHQAEENGYAFQGADALTLPTGEVHPLDGPALLVGLPVGRNYFHWMFEAVPRWLFASRVLGRDLTVLTQRLAPVERQALDFAGVPSASILEMPERAFIRVADLWVPPRGLQRAAGIVPEAVDALHALLSDRRRTRARVFISRAHARRRRIANERDVVRMLDRYGFEIVVPEEMSIERQAEVFAAADVVVGVHGAGLTNLVFASAGTLVVELQPPALDEARMTLYWNVASSRRLRYVQVVCAEAENHEDVASSARDIVVDVGDLDDTLRRHLGK